jgi:hypothetical protein
MRDTTLPPFDFSEADLLSPDERVSSSLRRAATHIASRKLQQHFEAPMIPAHGATPHELDELEAQLCAKLPHEYRAFLGNYRYLIIDSHFDIGGFDHEGVGFTEPVWVSYEHNPPKRHLVFAKWWLHGDGDQLLFALDEPGTPVVAYLHEHGAVLEPYAASFSLALWRLVIEATS